MIVYRDRILPRSERAFMRRQYVGFQTLRPAWVGRHIEPDLDRSQFPLGAVFDGWNGALFKEFGAVPHIDRLRALGAVCVHAQFGRGGALALPLARAMGLPLCVTFHGGEFKAAHYRHFPPALFRRRLKALQHYGALFVCVSPGVRARLLARGFASERTVMLPIGADLGEERPAGEAGSGIYFVGRFVEMKGASLLIEAVRRLRSGGYAEPVHLIGDGPARAGVERQAFGLENVRFYGWQSETEVQRALRTARMLCIPSIEARSGEREGLPSIAVEAMAAGAPVIASSEAGTDGLVEDGVCGRIFASRDVGALAGAIRELLDDPVRRRAYAQAGRRVVCSNFDAVKQSQRLEALLLHAAGEALKPRASG